jgi:hypothetical protein
MASDNCGKTAKSTGEPCQRPAGWGRDTDTGPCKFHAGTNADGSSHADNDNAKTHGAFSEHFRGDLTDAEERALEALVSHLESIDDERTVAAEIAAEALLKYKRSADSRFLREARQWFDDFNLLPNEDVTEIQGAGGGALNVNITDTVVETDERE